MDLVLFEEPSTEDHIVQLESAELEVGKLVDVPTLTFPLVFYIFWA
jgi:hypothetical protein